MQGRQIEEPPSHGAKVVPKVDFLVCHSILGQLLSAMGIDGHCSCLRSFVQGSLHERFVLLQLHLSEAGVKAAGHGVAGPLQLFCLEATPDISLRYANARHLTVTSPSPDGGAR